MTVQTPTRRVREQRPGPIRAQTLADLARGMNKLQRGVRAPRQVTERGNVRAVRVQQFKVVSVQQDYLVCRTWNGTEQGDSDVFVALPYLLRRTPFDGAARNGISYSYGDNVSRTASLSGEDEAQVMVPSYVAGDVIYAVRNSAGGTGVTANAAAVQWLDLNVDGRAWAKEAE